jgi:hypothetical protein
MEMFRRVMALLSVCLGGAASMPASAVWIIVPDVSQVAYMTDATGKVYLRNLDYFDSTNAVGCCYNYWIDTATIEGKNIFAIFLSSAAQGKGMRFGLPDARQPGAVSASGAW